MAPVIQAVSFTVSMLMLVCIFALLHLPQPLISVVDVGVGVDGVKVNIKMDRRVAKSDVFGQIRLGGYFTEDVKLPIESVKPLREAFETLQMFFLRRMYDLKMFGDYSDGNRASRWAKAIAHVSKLNEANIFEKQNISITLSKFFQQKQSGVREQTKQEQQKVLNGLDHSVKLLQKLNTSGIFTLAFENKNLLKEPASTIASSIAQGVLTKFDVRRQFWKTYYSTLYQAYAKVDAIKNNIVIDDYDLENEISGMVNEHAEKSVKQIQIEFVEPETAGSVHFKFNSPKDVQQFLYLVAQTKSTFSQYIGNEVYQDESIPLDDIGQRELFTEDVTLPGTLMKPLCEALHTRLVFLNKQYEVAPTKEQRQKIKNELEDSAKVLRKLSQGGRKFELAFRNIIKEPGTTIASLLADKKHYVQFSAKDVIAQFWWTYYWKLFEAYVKANASGIDMDDHELEFKIGDMVSRYASISVKNSEDDLDSEIEKYDFLGLFQHETNKNYMVGFQSPNRRFDELKFLHLVEKAKSELLVSSKTTRSTKQKQQPINLKKKKKKLVIFSREEIFKQNEQRYSSSKSLSLNLPPLRNKPQVSISKYQTQSNRNINQPQEIIRRRPKGKKVSFRGDKGNEEFKKALKEFPIQ